MTFKIHHLPKRFLIRTDTNLAGFLKSDLPKVMSQSKIQRLQAWFGEWQFKIEHVEGKENCLPNALTREMAYKCRSKIIPRQEDKKRMPPMQEANGKASRYLGRSQPQCCSIQTTKTLRMDRAIPYSRLHPEP